MVQPTGGDRAGAFQPRGPRGWRGAVLLKLSLKQSALDPLPRRRPARKRERPRHSRPGLAASAARTVARKNPRPRRPHAQGVSGQGGARRDARSGRAAVDVINNHPRDQSTRSRISSSVSASWGTSPKLNGARRARECLLHHLEPLVRALRRARTLHDGAAMVWDVGPGGFRITRPVPPAARVGRACSRRTTPPRGARGRRGRRAPAPLGSRPPARDRLPCGRAPRARAAPR